MKHIILNIAIFIVSLTILIISLVLFWNMGIFCDEYNLSPDIVCGGYPALLSDWARLLLSALLCLLSFINILNNRKINK